MRIVCEWSRHTSIIPTWKRNSADVNARSRKVHLINEHAIYKLICWWYLQQQLARTFYFVGEIAQKFSFLAAFSLKGQRIACSHLDHTQFDLGMNVGLVSNSHRGANKRFDLCTFLIVGHVKIILDLEFIYKPCGFYYFIGYFIETLFHFRFYGSQHVQIDINNILLT